MSTRTVRTPGDTSVEAKAARAAKAAAPKSKPIEATPATEPAAELSGLPNAIDIDPHSITGPVLTKQGWVCPADKPNPAARF